MICTRITVLAAAVSGLVVTTALELPYHGSTHAHDFDKRDPAALPHHPSGNGYEYYSSYGFGYGYMTQPPSPQSTRASTAQVDCVTDRRMLNKRRPRARFD